MQKVSLMCKTVRFCNIKRKKPQYYENFNQIAYHWLTSDECLIDGNYRRILLIYAEINRHLEIRKPIGYWNSKSHFYIAIFYSFFSCSFVFFFVKNQFLYLLNLMGLLNFHFSLFSICFLFINYNSTWSVS